MVVVAVSGEVGLLPTLAAAKAGKRIALANKESLVEAGEIITAEAARTGAVILPVDSEHSAIWQCLAGEVSAPERLILTASGGPFRGRARDELHEVTPEQALKHPSWQMGKKVTIDSATMMNKGLEVIEAHWLFQMPIDRISVILHPQSLVHSMVEFADGAIKAQLGCPDMRLPIQYALCYPERLASGLPRLDLGKIGQLVFGDPDLEAFPCLKLAMEAGRGGGTLPAVLSAADEMAVSMFLDGRIRFTDIASLVEQALAAHAVVARPTMDDILAASRWARQNVSRQGRWS
jgi:1-deoxy-D-xylulose-5-phosphate reductoisomerase